MSARYSYAIVEKVLDLPNNRSNIAVEAGFLATRKLATRVAFSWQRSHGGLRSNEIVTEEQLSQYDRLIKDNNFHITGGVSYSLPKFDRVRLVYVTTRAEPTRTSATPSRPA